MGFQFGSGGSLFDGGAPSLLATQTHVAGTRTEIIG